MRIHIALGVAAALALTGCGAAASPTVERWASPNPGSVNAYWIEGSEGIVVIDAGRNVAGGEAIAEKIAETGQRVVAILLTHPHPDHVGGLGVLHEKFPETPIYASQATDKWMREDPLGFYPLARQADPDYPSQLTYATETFTANDEILTAGLTFKTAEFGPGESATATVYYEPSMRALFAGDLTGNDVTPALIEGNSCGWLTNLNALSGLFPDADTIYPGHGDPGPAGQQITEQRDYLNHFRDAVRPAVSPDSDAGVTVIDRENAHIAAELDKAYPDYPRVASLPNLQQLNIAAVGRELVTEATVIVPPDCS